jgi:hypothetical protein
MTAILSPLGLYGGHRKAKLPLLHNSRIHTLEGHFGKSLRSTIGQMPDDRTLLSLDASLACDNPPRRIPYYRLNQSTLVIKK